MQEIEVALVPRFIFSLRTSELTGSAGHDALLSLACWVAPAACLAFLLLLGSFDLQAQLARPPIGPGRPNHNRPGPWDNDVLVYGVQPGGAPEKLATFERAGVPTVARLKDGRLLAAFQNFPADDNRNFDRVAVRFSSDEGRTWSKPAPIVVAGMEPVLARPFDPKGVAPYF